MLDLDNLYINACNVGLDARHRLAALNLRHVGELHLAGHAQTDHGLIDDHGSEICDAAWALYQLVRPQLSDAVPLIEWNHQIPPWPVLLREAGTVAILAEAACAIGESALH